MFIETLDFEMTEDTLEKTFRMGELLAKHGILFGGEPVDPDSAATIVSIALSVLHEVTQLTLVENHELVALNLENDELSAIEFFDRKGWH